MPKRKRKNPNGTGYLEQRGKAWRLTVRVGGVRHQETIHAEDEADAKRQAKKIIQDLEERADAGISTTQRVSGLLAVYEDDVLPTLTRNTRRSYPHSLAAISSFFVQKMGDPKLHRVKQGHVARFLAWRRVHGIHGSKLPAPVSNRTLERDRAVLHRLFKLAASWGWVTGNPVTPIEAPKYDKRDPILMTPAMLEKFFAECETRGRMLYTYAMLLAESGARCDSEGLRLKWQDVDLEGGYIEIVSGRDGHRTKGGRTRSVPMTVQLRAVMREHFAAFRFARYGGKPTEYVFHHTRTRRNHRAGDRIHSLREALKAAAGRAGVSGGWRVHDLRHLRATRWIADGGDVAKVQRALGHSVISTTMAYTHLVREDLKSLPGVQEPGEALKVS